MRCATHKEKVLEVAIGREVRAFRKKLGITVADLAAATSLSLGMLSKIENGITSPSLTTLQALSQGARRSGDRLLPPLRGGARVQSSSRQAKGWRSSGAARAPATSTICSAMSAPIRAGVVVEPYLITLSANSDVFPTFQHEGMEFLYMLEGEVVYRHGAHLFRMLPGDSLFFDADAPHGPEELTKLPIRYLSIISYPQSNQGD